MSATPDIQPPTSDVGLPPLGIVAAGGHLPVATAEGMRAAGRRIVCVGLKGLFEPHLPELCDAFRTAGLVQVGKWIRVLRKHGCEQMVLVGKVHKAQMYQPLLWFRYVPDLIGGKVWFVSTRHDKRANSMLTAVADELAASGITMIDSTEYIPELMADTGVMTRTRPTANQQADIDFALPIVSRMGDLDVGQAIAVKDRDVIAVEAIEGTDAMIERAGQLCRQGRWTLVKVAKPDQDMRFDVPTVGPTTIDKLKACGATCLAIEAGKTIMLDKAALLAAADKAGIAVVGIELPHHD